MAHPAFASRPALWLAPLAAALALGSGCATTGAPSRSFEFFATPGGGTDFWYAKVAEWQGRAQRDHVTHLFTERDAPVSRGETRYSSLLSTKMGAFATEERRALARRIDAWAQVQARKHYRWDNSKAPADDEWPTVQELLSRNGDDCDGLDLIAYQLLHEFGFPNNEVYRAVVRRDHDGANHMVTLWFEDPADPWVLDATGAMTAELRRFSELPGWTPTKVFNDTEQYRVVERPSAAHTTLAGSD
jgi:predicted transglutaminase-like cysteine proteinase